MGFDSYVKSYLWCVIPDIALFDRLVHDWENEPVFFFLLVKSFEGDFKENYSDQMLQNGFYWFPVVQGIFLH